MASTLRSFLLVGVAPLPLVVAPSQSGAESSSVHALAPRAVPRPSMGRKEPTRPTVVGSAERLARPSNTDSFNRVLESRSGGGIKRGTNSVEATPPRSGVTENESDNLAVAGLRMLLNPVFDP